MSNPIKVNDQVIVRQPTLGPAGKTQTVVRIGNVLAFQDNGTKAVVSFPQDGKRATVEVSKLEAVQSRLGRAYVNPNSVQRLIAWNQLGK